SPKRMVGGWSSTQHQGRARPSASCCSWLPTSRPSDPHSRRTAPAQAGSTFAGDCRHMTSTTLIVTDTSSSEVTKTTPAVDIVIPVHNEAADLAASVQRLHAFVRDQLPFSCRITIADNASTDSTLLIAREIADRVDDVRVVHLAQKGRGRALRAVWESSPATVLAYMDVDLSTDLAALLPLLAPLLSGHSDIA